MFIFSYISLFLFHLQLPLSSYVLVPWTPKFHCSSVLLSKTVLEVITFPQRGQKLSGQGCVTEHPRYVSSSFQSQYGGGWRQRPPPKIITFYFESCIKFVRKRIWNYDYVCVLWFGFLVCVCVCVCGGIVQLPLQEAPHVSWGRSELCVRVQSVRKHIYRKTGFFRKILSE